VKLSLGAPAPHAAFDGAAQAIPVVVGMAQLHLLEQRDRPQARAADQERQDVGLPQSAEQIDGLSPPRSLGGLLGRQPRIVLDAAGGALAQSAHGRGDALGVMTAGLPCTVSSADLWRGARAHRTSRKSRFRPCSHARRDQSRR
jgi:hypothetical protein